MIHVVETDRWSAAAPESVFATRAGICQSRAIIFLTLKLFHDNEGLPVVFADVINRADVGMIQGRGGMRLTLESGECMH